MIGDEGLMPDGAPSSHRAGTPSSANDGEDYGNDAELSEDSLFDQAALVVAATLQPAHPGAAPPLIRRAMATRLMQTMRFDQRRTSNVPQPKGGAQAGKRRRNQSTDNNANEDGEAGSKRKLKRPGKLEINNDDDELNLDIERLERLKSEDASGVVTPRSITPTTTEIFTEPTTPMLLHSPLNDLTPPGTPGDALGFGDSLPSEDYIMERIDELRAEKRKVFAMVMARADTDMKKPTPEPASSRRTTGDSSTFSLDDEPNSGNSAEAGMPIPTVDSSDRFVTSKVPAISTRPVMKRAGSPTLSPPPYPTKAPRTDGFARPIPPRNDRPPQFGYQHQPNYPPQQGGFREDWKPRPSSMSSGFQPHRFMDGPYPRPGPLAGSGPHYQQRHWQSGPGSPATPPAFYAARRPPGPGYGVPPPPPPKAAQGSSSLSRGWQPGNGGGGNGSWSGWKSRPDRDWA